MKDQTEFSTQESLRLINEMIGKARKSYTSKGIASIVWGLLIMVCGLISWAEQQFLFNIGFDIWLLLIAALAPQIYFGVKEKRSRNFVGHDEQTLLFVWTAYAICIFITSFYSGKIGNESDASLIMMLFGLPTFITGGILKFKPMIAGGIICWVLSIASIFSNNATDMFLMAVCGLFAWFIPGIILWNKYKKQQSQNV